MTIPLHIIHLLMEDITAALCLDNRLRATALPHLGRKQEEQAGFRLLSSAVHSPACFFSLCYSSPLPPSLPPCLFQSSPPAIDLAVVFTICQWFMPAGRPPNPLSGRTTVSTLFFARTVKTTWRKGTAEKRGRARWRGEDWGKVRCAI